MVRMHRGQLCIDDLIGTQIVLSPGDILIAGRAADFLLGSDDPAMHRRFLQIWDGGGTWMVKNIGSFLTAIIQQREADRYSPVRLAPGATHAVPVGVSALYFSTKNLDYEIEITVAQARPEPNVDHAPLAPFTHGTFEPNPEQQVIMRELARPLLRDPSKDPRQVTPSISELADITGWSEKKISQKIQHIAESLQQLGVQDFQPGITIPWRIVVARFAAENPQIYQ